MQLGGKALRVLLVHPSDKIEEGVWDAQSWERIIDLGWSPSHTYECSTAKFNCPVEAIGTYRRAQEDCVVLREIFSQECGCEDAENINWWETLGILFHQ